MTDREALKLLETAARDYLSALSNRTAAITGDKLGQVLRLVKAHMDKPERY